MKSTQIKESTSAHDIFPIFKPFFIILQTTIQQARAHVTWIVTLYNHTDTRNTTRAQSPFPTLLMGPMHHYGTHGPKYAF